MANEVSLTRRELEVINRQNLKYPLAIAEKDYFLALVSKIVYESVLKDKLLFKGGTALHHCYLNQMRFSEDLDFSFREKVFQPSKSTFDTVYPVIFTSFIYHLSSEEICAEKIRQRNE